VCETVGTDDLPAATDDELEDRHVDCGVWWLNDDDDVGA